MNIQFSAYSRRVHRLFIATPLFLVVVLSSLWSAVLWREKATMLPEDVHVLSGGGRIEDAADALLLRSASGTVLEEGTVTVIARGIARIRACGKTFSAWAGGLRLGAEEGRCTVAALTTPVLVEEEASAPVVLLPLTQTTLNKTEGKAATGALASVRSVTMLSLPPHYLRTYVPLVRDAVAAAEGQTGLQEELLTMEQEQDGDTGSRMVADLLREGRAPLRLPSALEERDAWLLASFHPLLKKYAWVLPVPPTASEEDRMLALLLLPRSDMQADEAPDGVVQRWKELWDAVLAKEADPARLLAESLPSIRASIEGLKHDRYPARAKRYAVAFLDVLRPWRPVLVSGTQQDIAALEELLLPSLPREIPPSFSASSVSSAPSSSEAFDAQAMQGEAKGVLLNAGIMFTRETALTPLDAERVAVRGAVLGTARGDRMMDFVFVLPTRRVERIVREGKILPNGLPLREFVEWGRREG